MTMIIMKIMVIDSEESVDMQTYDNHADDTSLINFKRDACITMLLWSDTIDVDGDEEEDMIMYLPHKMLMFRSIN